MLSLLCESCESSALKRKGEKLFVQPLKSSLGQRKSQHMGKNLPFHVLFSLVLTKWCYLRSYSRQNYTTVIFFSSKKYRCWIYVLIRSFLNCDACGNAHNLPACQTLDCTLLWGCCLLLLLLTWVHKYMCCDLSFFCVPFTMRRVLNRVIICSRVLLSSQVQGHTHSDFIN